MFQRSRKHQSDWKLSCHIVLFEKVGCETKVDTYQVFFNILQKS